MTHTVVVGGGVIGLSIAYELSKRNRKVVLLEKGVIGKRASWAGAGILPPAEDKDPIHPLEQLESLSNRLHSQWAKELLLATGIDTEFRKCGGFYVARTPGEKAALVGAMEGWRQRQIPFEVVDPLRANQLVPGNDLPEKTMMAWVPSESQVRNPRFLKALHQACARSGVIIRENCPSLKLIMNETQTKFVQSGEERFEAERFCIACGPWTEQLVATVGRQLTTTPVRGQIVLFKLPAQQFVPIVNEGSRYLVPRLDGHVLAGSTIDEIGFDDSTDAADIDQLSAWANQLVPSLNKATFMNAWAGLRPGTYDGFPYLGGVGNSANTFVATGHFKSGLHLAPATAVVMSDLLEAKVPEIDLAPFAPDRAEYHKSIETR